MDELNVSSHQSSSIQIINNPQYNSSEVLTSSRAETKESTKPTDQNESNKIQFTNATFDESETNVINEGTNLLHTKSSISDLKNETGEKDTEIFSSGQSTEIEKQSSVSLGSNKLLFHTPAEESQESHLSEKLSKSDESIILTCEPYWEHVPGIGPVVPEHQLTAVVEYMKYWAAKQEGMVMPRNVKHFLCPPLDAEMPATDVVSIN